MKLNKSLAVFAAAVLVFCTGDFFTVPAQAAPRIGYFEGNVQVKPSPGSEWRPAAVDMPLEQGAEVVTDGQSTCTVLLGKDEESALKLHPSTRAVLTTLEPVKVDIQTGRIFALVRGLKPGSGFHVATPTAVASARGTGFGADGDSVEVYEDDVDVDGKGGGQQNVGEGDGIVVHPDGSLGETFRIPEELWDEWEAFLEELHEELGDDFDLMDAYDRFLDTLDDGQESDDDPDDYLEDDDGNTRGQIEQFYLNVKPQ